MIVDECHRAAAQENSKSICVEKEIFTLGLSATPERQYDNGFEDILLPILGPVIINYDYKQAHIDGVICDFDLINVKVEMSEDERNEYEDLGRKIAISYSNSGEESDEFLSLCRKRSLSVANLQLRIPTVCKIVEENKSSKIIVFHESISSVNAIAKLLNDRGMYALAYHSKLSDAIRRDNLIKFKKGDCNVLVTCRALDEGANVPG